MENNELADQIENIKEQMQGVSKVKNRVVPLNEKQWKMFEDMDKNEK